MQATQEKPRWQYRFDNYSRAFSLLREAVELQQKRPLSDLEKEGVIQRVEYTWELAWKTIKDYLENEGVVLEKITPKAVIVAALEARIIIRKEHWMRALDDRNRMNHVYSRIVFDDSSLGLRVDVQAYQHIQYPPLKRHIDTMAKVLFTRQEIKAELESIVCKNTAL